MVESGFSNGLPGRSDDDHSPFRVSLTGTPALVIVGICLIVLSIGAVACMLLFIYLCFTHPDTANLLIPLLLAPLGGAVILSGKKVADAFIGERKTIRANKPREDNII